MTGPALTSSVSSFLYAIAVRATTKTPVAAMAGTVRLISAPANAPAANAATVQAANVTAVSPNCAGCHRLSLASGSTCASHQLTRTPKAPLAAVSATPSPTSLATTHRVGPAVWVHANLKVPASYSRASRGAATNIPISTGIAGRATVTNSTLPVSG